jgi:hypothetical protein
MMQHRHHDGGVTLWRLGGEDPAAWFALRSRFDGAAPPSDTVPTVVVMSPSSVAAVTAYR